MVRRAKIHRDVVLSSRVLIVDDDPDIAWLLREQLSDVGYQVVGYATSGAEALRQIKELHPEIIVMDVGLAGDLDGIETVTRIPADLRAPVIYVTGRTEGAILERAASTKPHGYLVKPFRAVELHVTIQMALERHAAELALRKAEADLRQSEARFRELAENIQEVFWLKSATTAEIFFVSPAFQTIWALTNEALYRDPSLWLASIHPADRANFIEARAEWEECGEHKAEYRIVRPDGTVRWISDRAFPIRNETGSVYRIAGVAEDVTERKQAEAQLRHAQKMEAIGQLTGGVAHDFNNLLAIIQLNLELLEERLSDDAEAHEMTLTAHRAAERGASLTHQLLAFARQQTLEPKIVDLTALVTGQTKMFRRILGENIEIKTVMAPDLWAARVDPHQLENALLNLAVNGRDAMTNGGCLIIEGVNQVLDEIYAEQIPDLLPGDYIMLAVTDTGAGIPANIMGRVLDPFFTTKPIGAGSGLGLSMVHGFVKQSGGHLKIYSEPGRGTTIQLYFPRVRETRAPDVPATFSAAPDTAVDETILVVEDDDVLRSLTVRILKALGYRVIDAPDGPTACTVLDEVGQLDLLVTDVVLPKGMRGPDIARAAHLRRPKLKVLYISGYPRDAVHHTGLLDEHAHLLPKPFSKSRLASKIREVLDQVGGG